MHFNKILKNTITWKLLNTVFIFFINLMMVRLLGVSESGLFFYDITLLSFLILALSWSLETGITYYAVRDNNITKAVLTILVPIVLSQGLVSWFVLSNLHLYITGFIPIVFILSNLCCSYLSALLYAKRKFILVNKIACSINFILILLLLSGYFSIFRQTQNQQYFTSIYVGGIAVQAILLLVLLIVKPEKTKGSDAVLMPLTRKIISYSSIAFVSNIVFFLVTRIDYFFVEKNCSTIALSNYVQVSKFGQLLVLIPSIISSMVFPYSADKKEGISIQKVQQLCKTISLIFIFLTVLVVGLTHWILPFIFGEGFNQMYIALLIYMPGFFALSIISILAAYLAGEKHLSVNLIAAVFALIIVITGDILLIPFWGINGAALISSLAYIACGCYLLHFYKIKYNCKLSAFFPLKKQEIFYIIWQLKKIFNQ